MGLRYRPGATTLVKIYIRNLEHKAAENIVGAMDKNDGDNLPEGFPGNLPEDPLILADITKRISREIDGKIGPDGLAVTEARRDRNLVGEWEEDDAALDNQPSTVPFFLVLYVLSMLGLVGYAIARWYFLWRA